MSSKKRLKKGLKETEQTNLFFSMEKQEREDFKEKIEEENFDLPLINLKLDDSLDN